ncbi:ABC transporter ATP-binding protein [Streptomyces beijiangensis]|uniref:ABC transporter ATP-binding protein n=1 Tax=Streptomyces beijiangensis TaxID=163361 RepID=A0A939JGH4_9ACTN|nr:ABC transporter ATP-binding protein [Streptomyces beijiangensis]MBO0510514.1 ABC transporter ATP-binding protein [Streptomyces beijiangensis]
MSALPVASARTVRRAAYDLIRIDRRAFAAVLALNSAAAAAGLVAPWLLGRIIDTIRSGGTGAHALSEVDRLAAVAVVFALVQTLLARYARYLAHRFGERTSARVRERYTDRALALPAAVVERAGTGDLTTRGTSDVTAVGTTMRDAAPDVFVAAIQALFILAAVLFIDPLLGMCGLVGLVGVGCAARWYLRRARAAYLAEGEANSALTEVLATTAAGARTVEALSLQERRIAACEAAVERHRRTRHRTLALRSVLFPALDVSYVVPVVGVLLLGGVLHQHGVVSLGAVVASAVYLQQLSHPLNAILFVIDQMQSSGAAFARVEGLGEVPTVEPGSSAAPADDQIEVAGARYAYGGGRDVLHGVDLTVRPGERLAVVGPSGAGKSTLGRLLAGIDAPREGSVTVGGTPVAGLDPEQLRRQVVLVTQEHHVFLGTVRDNLVIAAPDAGDEKLRAALAAVGAEWADDLDAELGGPGGRHLDGAQAQQLALARVVLADPHTLILDEATALLDPTTARHTERALAAVLEGRTVIAIAHRLHTAHDADRVAVMADGRIAELGTHDELVADGGAYAALWESWHGA